LFATAATKAVLRLSNAGWGLHRQLPAGTIISLWASLKASLEIGPVLTSLLSFIYICLILKVRSNFIPF